MNIETKLNSILGKWHQTDLFKSKASIELIHMIEANFSQLQFSLNWIIDLKNRAILDKTPYYGRYPETDEPPFNQDINTWRLYTSSINTLFYSFFMTTRSIYDNLYRLHLENIQPKSKWGMHTSIKDGLKKTHFTNKINNLEELENNFNRTRWIRNCYKTGAYCTSSGIEKDGSLFINLIMIEKDFKRISPISERITENDLNISVEICDLILDAISESN